jgi:hypothetical protein
VAVLYEKRLKAEFGRGKEEGGRERRNDLIELGEFFFFSAFHLPISDFKSCRLHSNH